MAGSQKTILVTGASSGIGEAAVRRLAREGWHVFAGVRRAEDGDALVNGHIEPLLLDVTDPAQIEAAVARIGEAVGAAGLDGLVNNAGLMLGGPLEFFPPQRLRELIEVNVIGVHALTRAMLPLLRRARGRIINISSISGRMALPLFGPYNASKFALEALSDALRMELASQGIEVVVIEPGPVKSRIWNKAHQHAGELRAGLTAEGEALYGELIDGIERLSRQSEEQAIAAEPVADLIRHALTTPRPRPRYPIGRLARTRDWAARLLPDRLRDRLILGIIARSQTLRRPR